MKAIWIAGWQILYEVNSQGHEFKPGKRGKAGALQLKPLPYVRWQVHGRSRGPKYQMLAQVARTGRRLMAAYATFGKLAEIAGQNTRDRRGWVLNKDDSPCVVEDLIFYTGFPQKAVEESLAVLSDPQAAWIEFREFPAFPENPGVSGKSGPLHEPEPEHEHEHEPEPKAPQKRGPGDNLGTTASAAAKNKSSYSAAAFRTGVMTILQLCPERGGSAQNGHDHRSLLQAGGHVMAGRLGENIEAVVLDCLTMADRIAKDSGNTQKTAMARWLGWFKKRLEERGHEWEYAT